MTTDATCIVLRCRGQAEVLLVVDGGRLGFLCVDCALGFGPIVEGEGSVPMKVEVDGLHEVWKLEADPKDPHAARLRRLSTDPDE